MDIQTRGILLSKQRITKGLIRLNYAFVVRIWQNRFSHDVAQLFMHLLIDRFPPSKTITSSHLKLFNGHYSLECPTSPATGSSDLSAVQQCGLTGDPCLSLNISFWFYLLNVL